MVSTDYLVKFGTWQRTHRVLNEVQDERRRQDDLKAEGRFKHTFTDLEMSNTDRLIELAREFGEVVEAINYTGAGKVRDNLREELIQVAACCVAWVEGLDALEAAAK